MRNIYTPKIDFGPQILYTVYLYIYGGSIHNSCSILA